MEYSGMTYDYETSTTLDSTIYSDFENNESNIRNKSSGYDVDDIDLNDFFRCVRYNNDILALNTKSSDFNENFMNNNVLIYKRSRLLNIICRYKARYPNKMGLVEYLLHSYVVLYSSNPITILNYDAIFKNIKPENDEFWKSLRKLTRMQLEIESFPNNIAKYISILLENINSKIPFTSLKSAESRRLDGHFTWLCKCCTNINDDNRTNSIPEFGNIFNKNYDLSSDVMYEALKQRGNRFIQRSLYNNVKNSSGSYTRGINPNVVSKLNASNTRIKNFMDMVQQSSLDINDNYNSKRLPRKCVFLKKRLS